MGFISVFYTIMGLLVLAALYEGKAERAEDEMHAARARERQAAEILTGEAEVAQEAYLEERGARIKAEQETDRLWAEVRSLESRDLNRP